VFAFSDEVLDVLSALVIEFPAASFKLFVETP